MKRFVGGFVDRDDKSYEMAARREFREETGGCNLSSLEIYRITKIDDWRYGNEDQA
jgi:bifunctional NMN adenylyltransferase/nudix hydrolase